MTDKELREQIAMYTDTPRHVDNILALIEEAGYRLQPQVDGELELTGEELKGLRKPNGYCAVGPGTSSSYDNAKAVSQATVRKCQSIIEARVAREILGPMNMRDVGGINPEWALSDKQYHEFLSRYVKEEG